eukprot:scaffold271876_cov18-Tisochrysis_lutea.AAC.2
MAALGTTVGASSLWCWCCGERGCPEGKLLGPSGADNERSSLKEDVLAERALPRKAIRAWLPREVQGYNSCAWLELGSRFQVVAVQRLSTDFKQTVPHQ